MNLAAILDEALDEAKVLDGNNASFSVERVRQLIADITLAAEDYLKFISEAEARLQSNKSIAWLRGNFTTWAAQGDAEYRGKKRYYRAIVIPRRPDLEAAREAGRHGMTHAG